MQLSLVFDISIHIQISRTCSVQMGYIVVLVFKFAALAEHSKWAFKRNSLYD
jgi:hypothetical protein